MHRMIYRQRRIAGLIMARAVVYGMGYGGTKRRRGAARANGAASMIGARCAWVKLHSRRAFFLLRLLLPFGRGDTDGALAGYKTPTRLFYLLALGITSLAEVSLLRSSRKLMKHSLAEIFKFDCFFFYLKW